MGNKKNGETEPVVHLVVDADGKPVGAETADGIALITGYLSTLHLDKLMQGKSVQINFNDNGDVTKTIVHG